MITLVLMDKCRVLISYLNLIRMDNTCGIIMRRLALLEVVLFGRGLISLRKLIVNLTTLSNTFPDIDREFRTRVELEFRLLVSCGYLILFLWTCRLTVRPWAFTFCIALVLRFVASILYS